MELIEIAHELADYLHERRQTFADVADQLERQVNGHLELAAEDDAMLRPEDWSVFAGDNMQDDEPAHLFTLSRVDQKRQPYE